MTVYFISRHAGAQEWANENGFKGAVMVHHFNPAVVNPCDLVIGTLPVNLAAQVCAAGGRYYHLTLDLPAEMRGRELSASEMRSLGAFVEEYQVTKVT